MKRSCDAFHLASVALFAAVAVLQALRFVMGWPLQVGAIDVPPVLSLAAALLAGGFAFWGWRTRS